MEITKALAGSVLKHAEAFEWSLQGLGMLRTYLDDKRRYRLHVWSRKHAYPNVSKMHTHPWGFKSEIVAGAIVNTRFTIALPNAPVGHDYCVQSIVCGSGGCAKGDVCTVRLVAGAPEVYHEGQRYEQGADEIHLSLPECGTVTVLDRVNGPDPDLANVFWPAGQQWVSAMPRPATPEEVREITKMALDRWF